MHMLLIFAVVALAVYLSGLGGFISKYMDMQLSGTMALILLIVLLLPVLRAILMRRRIDGWRGEDWPGESEQSKKFRSVLKWFAITLAGANAGVVISGPLGVLACSYLSTLYCK